MDAIAALNWVALIAFYVGIIYFFHKNKKNVTKQWGIFFAYRTKRGLKFIKNLAAKLRRFWVIYGYVGIPVVFIAMIGMVFMLITSIVDMLAAPKVAAPVAGLVVPWVSTGVHGAVITVSILYFVIAVLVTLIVHEGAHALISATHRKRLLSAGIGLFAVIPFAFVEPDEKQIEKSKTREQLAIYAAGPFTNFVTAILVFLLAAFLILPPIAGSMEINGLEIQSLDESMPAGLSALQEGDIISRIDDVSFMGAQAIQVNALSPNYLGALSLPPEKLETLRTEPGQVIEIETVDGKIVQLTAETTTDKPTTMGKLALKMGLMDDTQFEPRGVLGFSSLKYVMEQKPGSSATTLGILGTIYAVLAWIIIFNVGIGLFNTLPIGPLDGGRMAKTALGKLFKRKKKIGLKLFSLISTFVLFVLLFGMFGSYLLQLF